METEEELLDEDDDFTLLLPFVLDFVPESGLTADEPDSSWEPDMEPDSEDFESPGSELVIIPDCRLELEPEPIPEPGFFWPMHAACKIMMISTQDILKTFFILSSSLHDMYPIL